MLKRLAGFLAFVLLFSGCASSFLASLQDTAKNVKSAARSIAVDASRPELPANYKSWPHKFSRRCTLDNKKAFVIEAHARTDNQGTTEILVGTFVILPLARRPLSFVIIRAHGTVDETIAQDIFIPGIMQWKKIDGRKFNNLVEAREEFFASVDKELGVTETELNSNSFCRMVFNTFSKFLNETLPRKSQTSSR